MSSTESSVNGQTRDDDGNKIHKDGDGVWIGIFMVMIAKAVG